MTLKGHIDRSYERNVREVVYSMQRQVMSSQVPDIIRRTLIDELQSVIEDFEHGVPEKHLRIILAKEFPSRIREISQIFIDQLQLALALSDEARDACKSIKIKELIETGVILPNPRIKKDQFLRYLLLRFYLRNFKKLTKHIPVNVRRHLSQNYRLPSDYYDRSIPRITGTLFVYVIKKIHGELKRLERLYKLYDLIFNCSLCDVWKLKPYRTLSYNLYKLYDIFNCSLCDVWKLKPYRTLSYMEIFKNGAELDAEEGSIENCDNKNLLNLLDDILVEVEDPSLPKPTVKRESALTMLSVSSCTCAPPETPSKEATSPSPSASSFATKCTIYPSASSLTQSFCKFKDGYKNL